MDTPFIDTHAHLNLADFDADIEVVTGRCLFEEVSVINIGTNETTSGRAVELSLRYKHMYAMIGLHPIQVCGRGREGETFNDEYYRNLIRVAKGRVVGIGECGFDYYHTTPDTYGIQEAAFISQIQFANEMGLPLMIHTRGPKPGETSPTGRSVYADVCAVLKQYAKVPFNVHFYAGTYEEAKFFFEIGGTISFTGVITFAKVYEDIVCATPLDLMHAETDCPYVAPVPYRGTRGEPWMVKAVYKKIAAIRGEDEEMVRQVLRANAERFYKI